MARLPLLSRDGEVRVGQAIEEGTKQAHSALFSCPVTAYAMNDIVERVRARRTRIVEIVRDAEDDPETFDEIAAEERLSKLVVKVGKLEAQREALATERVRANADRKSVIDSELRRIATESVALFEEMRLTESALRSLTAQVRATLDSDRPPV